MKLQNTKQCILCSGCEEDSNFDYCRGCGFTNRLPVEEPPIEHETPLGRAVRLARGHQGPPEKPIQFDGPETNPPAVAQEPLKSSLQLMFEADERGEFDYPVAQERPTHCPKCHYPEEKNSTPSKRVHFCCGSYMLEGQDSLIRQTDLCSAREELAEANEKLAEQLALNRQLVLDRSSALMAMKKQGPKLESQAEEIERLRSVLSAFDKASDLWRPIGDNEDVWNQDEGIALEALYGRLSEALSASSGAREPAESEG